MSGGHKFFIPLAVIPSYRVPAIEVPVADEIELKLAVSADLVGRLKRNPLIRSLATKRAITVPLLREWLQREIPWRR